MSIDKDNLILVIIDKEGYICAAGEPKCFTAKDLKEYISYGCDIKNMLHSEYKQLANRQLGSVKKLLLLNRRYTKHLKAILFKSIMFITVYYFPKMFLPALNEVLKEKEYGIELIQEYPRDDSQFTELGFECRDEGDILMLGYRICFYEMSKAITEKAMPQVMKNIETLINKVTESSEN